MSRGGSRSRVLARLALALLLAIITIGPALTVAPQNVAAAEVLTVRKFDTTEKVMALTFDAGSDTGYAKQILDTLASKDVKASFGMTGVWAQANPDLVRRMVNDGHQLINHSWDHPHFPQISSAERASQLSRTEDLVHSQTGVWMKPYFRPPYGEYNQSTLNDLAANGYTVSVMWTTDTMGWNGATSSQIVQKTLDQATPGGIVLMHVGAASQDAAALPAMIDQLRARGYRFQTVRDFIAPTSRYFPETGHTVSGNFLRYWNGFGGLASFGFPISDVFTRDGVQMQYFERVRMELHPGVWPARYDVLLGLLGVQLTAGRGGEKPFQRIVASSDANCNFYQPTGHRLCFGFRDYWVSHGGLEIFGYPISEEFQERNRETGDVYTVQYFERARFEYHPENRPPWNVLGGHLGRQAMDAGY
ncbi:MAG: polysaccharide deacetylase family protein [Thermomicrobiales bacterium]